MRWHTRSAGDQPPLRCPTRLSSRVREGLWRRSFGGVPAQRTPCSVTPRGSKDASAWLTRLVAAGQRLTVVGQLLGSNGALALQVDNLTL